MRIAYLTGEYPRATDTFIQREVAALRTCGLRIETISIRRPRASEHVSPQQEDESKRTFYVLPCSPWRLILASCRFLVTQPRRYFKALHLAATTRQPGVRGAIYQLFYFVEAAVVGEALLQKGVTHLHNHFANSSCSVSMLASELTGLPFSFTLHGPAIFFEPHRWRLDEKIRRASFVSCISHYCRSQAMIFSHPDDWTKLHIVHCGVDCDHYMIREHQGDAKQLLFVGRLAGVKGLAVLIEAMAKLRDQQMPLALTIIGDGPDRARLEQQVEKLQLTFQVDFVGYQSPAAVSDILGRTDIFVLPSFAEGVPVVLMEAMASGVPVIATRIAGISELVEENQSGLLVPPGDTQSLTQNIATLVQDPARRTSMGQIGRAKVRQFFNQTREAEWLYHILQSSAAGSPPDYTPPELRSTEYSS